MKFTCVLSKKTFIFKIKLKFAHHRYRINRFKEKNSDESVTYCKAKNKVSKCTANQQARCEY